MIIIISFLIATIIFGIWAEKKNKKEKEEYYERLKETIKEAFKELDEEMYFNNDDDFDKQDEELNNLHKVVENDINDLEYTLRKEIEEYGK